MMKGKKPEHISSILKLVASKCGSMQSVIKIFKTTTAKNEF